MGDFLYFLYESPCSKASWGPHHSPSLGMSVCLSFTPVCVLPSLSLSPLLYLFHFILCFMCFIFSASVYFSSYLNSMLVCLFLHIISFALHFSLRLSDTSFNRHLSFQFDEEKSCAPMITALAIPLRSENYLRLWCFSPREAL